MLGKKIAAKLIAVVVGEDAAKIILRDSPLADVVDLIDAPLFVFKFETFVVIRVDDPVVERVHQAIGLMLGISANAVVGGDDGLLIGDSIAIRVATENQIRRNGNER